MMSPHRARSSSTASVVPGLNGEIDPDLRPDEVEAIFIKMAQRGFLDKSCNNSAENGNSTSDVKARL
jgi:hypothetical protein